MTPGKPFGPGNPGRERVEKKRDGGKIKGRRKLRRNCGKKSGGN